MNEIDKRGTGNMNDIETRLRTTLESVAARTDVEDRLHEIVTDRTVTHRPRSGLLVAAAAFLVISVGFGTFLLASTGTDNFLVASEAPTVAPEAPAAPALPSPTLPNGDPWPLPRLSIDTSQLDPQLSLRSLNSEFTAADASLAGNARPYLQVLRRDPNTFEPPMIWIETNQTGSDYLRSGAAKRESTQELVIDSTAFFLLEDGDRTLLTGELPNGAAVYIAGLGVKSADLIDFANGLISAAPGTGWDVPEPPMDMQVVFEGHLPNIYDQPGYASQLVSWGSGSPDDGQEGRVEFLIESWGEAGFELRLYEAASEATDQTFVRTGDVGSRPAAIIELQDSLLVVWRTTDVATAHLALVSSELRLEQLLAALIEVDETTWQAMKEKIASRFPTSTTLPPAAIPGGEPNE